MSADENRKGASGGISFLGALTIVFVTLKLCGVIGWSWWWVLAPIWIPWGVLILLMLIAAVVDTCRK